MDMRTALIATALTVVMPATLLVNQPEAPPDRAVAGVNYSAPEAKVETKSITLPRATGSYQWLCLLSDGRQYFLPRGEPMTNCKGTYLAKYLDGKRLQTYRLSAAGQVIAPWSGDLRGCLLAVVSLGAGVAALVINPPTGAARWFSAVSTGGGVLSLGACLG